MQIKPTDRTIKSLLEGGFYKIPRFQRPYSWDKENVDDFWSDAIASAFPDYFIGSFVLYLEKQNSDTYMVVDGQQRLTTTTLLLAAIRNAFHSLDELNLAKGVQKLIEREDINNHLRYILSTETSYPYFQEHIQKYGKPQLSKKAGREEQALEQAFNYLTDQVTSVLLSVDTDPSISAKKRTEEKLSRLTKIRDNVLRLQLIVVELMTEDEAYLIFETLNTRGKDLGVSDLVKNLITRLLKPANKGVDVAKDKWNLILAKFNESGVSIDINSFIHHSWLSRYTYTGKEGLFRAIKSEVSEANVSQFLDNLVRDAELYRGVFEPSSAKWAKEERDLVASFNALNIFKVVQPVPMTLSILRSYKDGPLTLKQAKKILRQLENFHVQFTALTGQRTGGGTAKMYASTAEELTKAKNGNTAETALRDFKKKMEDRKPTYPEFEAGFMELEFLSDNTKQKNLVQYILRRLDIHQRAGAPIDYDTMTIEHIAPENPQAGGGIKPTMVGKVGNLVLLDEALNGKVGNKDFLAKRKIYEDASVPLDDTIAKASKWTDSEIDARTKRLAKLAYDRVFKL